MEATTNQRAHAGAETPARPSPRIASRGGERMAVSQGKRSIRRAQLSHRAHRSNKLTRSYRKLFHFPQVKDKLVEDVEFSSDLGYHCVTVNFKDKTCLNFAIDAGFTVETDYSDWKTGNQRIIRRWRAVRGLEFRDFIKQNRGERG